MKMEYKERKELRYIFSLAENGGNIMNEPLDLEIKDTESELYAINCHWKNIPQDDVFLFSINERDDRKGFCVDLRNLKISKNTATVIEDCPKWLKWCLSKILTVW